MKKNCTNHFWRETTIKNKQFQEKNMISNSNLIRQSTPLPFIQTFINLFALFILFFLVPGFNMFLLEVEN